MSKGAPITYLSALRFPESHSLALRSKIPPTLATKNHRDGDASSAPWQLVLLFGVIFAALIGGAAAILTAVRLEEKVISAGELTWWDTAVSAVIGAGAIQAQLILLAVGAARFGEKEIIVVASLTPLCLASAAICRIICDAIFQKKKICPACHLS